MFSVNKSSPQGEEKLMVPLSTNNRPLYLEMGLFTSNLCCPKQKANKWCKIQNGEGDTHRLLLSDRAQRRAPMAGTVTHLFLPHQGVVVLITQSCLTLLDSTDCSPPGSSVHGIFQARTLEWVAISSSRGSSQPRDRTHISYISCTGRQVLYH